MRSRYLKNAPELKHSQNKAGKMLRTHFHNVRLDAEIFLPALINRLGHKNYIFTRLSIPKRVDTIQANLNVFPGFGGSRRRVDFIYESSI
jgi:hypothetical protein